MASRTKRETKDYLGVQNSFPRRSLSIKCKENHLRRRGSGDSRRSQGIARHGLERCPIWLYSHVLIQRGDTWLPILESRLLEKPFARETLPHFGPLRRRPGKISKGSRRRHFAFPVSGPVGGSGQPRQSRSGPTELCATPGSDFLASARMAMVRIVVFGRNQGRFQNHRSLQQSAAQRTQGIHGQENHQRGLVRGKLDRA
mmetsp:Transcript_16766/g.34556  ORF Transcript_16766/g.34556 Transcript_16766/m.34556 type:complete len:200 (+) Transcript_16766:1741-2340(+)